MGSSWGSLGGQPGQKALYNSLCCSQGTRDRRGNDLKLRVGHREEFFRVKGCQAREGTGHVGVPIHAGALGRTGCDTQRTGLDENQSQAGPSGLGGSFPTWMTL